jgi:hypothetical protein
MSIIANLLDVLAFPDKFRLAALKVVPDLHSNVYNNTFDILNQEVRFTGRILSGSETTTNLVTLSL